MARMPARDGERTPRRGGAPPHTRTCSRREASRFSPMPGDLAELLDRAEAAVLLAVLEDRARHRRADAVELVELLGGRGVEVERDALGRLAAPAAAARRAQRHQDLAAVLELGGEVERGEVGAAAGAAGAADGVDDPRARRQPVDARPPHGARDVDGHPRRATAALLPHPDRRRGAAPARSLTAPEVARARAATTASRPSAHRARTWRGRVGHARRR